MCFPALAVGSRNRRPSGQLTAANGSKINSRSRLGINRSPGRRYHSLSRSGSGWGRHKNWPWPGLNIKFIYCIFRRIRRSLKCKKLKFNQVYLLTLTKLPFTGLDQINKNKSNNSNHGARSWTAKRPILWSSSQAAQA